MISNKCLEIFDTYFDGYKEYILDTSIRVILNVDLDSTKVGLHKLYEYDEFKSKGLVEEYRWKFKKELYGK